MSTFSVQFVMHNASGTTTLSSINRRRGPLPQVMELESAISLPACRFCRGFGSSKCFHCNAGARHDWALHNIGQRIANANVWFHVEVLERAVNPVEIEDNTDAVWFAKYARRRWQKALDFAKTLVPIESAPYRSYDYYMGACSDIISRVEGEYSISCHRYYARRPGSDFSDREEVCAAAARRRTTHPREPGADPVALAEAHASQFRDQWIIDNSPS